MRTIIGVTQVALVALHLTHARRAEFIGSCVGPLAAFRFGRGAEPFAFHGPFSPWILAKRSATGNRKKDQCGWSWVGGTGLLCHLLW